MKYLLVTIAVILPFLCYEIFLRAVGYQPLSSRTLASIFKFPLAYENDEILGWKLIPGKHRFEPISPKARETSGQILARGNRATHSEELVSPSISKGTILFVGDSFTYGDGLNDEETYPWVVQKLLKDYTVLNFAVPGYGTCQTYLELLKLNKSDDFKNATIVYGMSEFHETRNMPDERTAWQFAAVSTKKSYSAPSCYLDKEGHLQSTPPKSYYDPLPFLSENFSVGRRLMHFYYDLLDLKTRSLKRPLSFALVKAIKDLATHHKQQFVVLLQRFTPKAHAEYQKFLAETGIKTIDGYHPKESMPEMQLVGDAHPNAVMNRYWGEIVSQALTSP